MVKKEWYLSFERLSNYNQFYPNSVNQIIDELLSME